MMGSQSENVENKFVKILLIDDDSELQSILSSVFEPMNISLIGITTGKEAQEYIKDQGKMEDTSLVLIERILPDMEGLDLVDQITKRYQHTLPIVIISSLSSEKDVVEGLHRGAVEYITKPFNIKVLIEKIHSLLEWKK